MLKLKLPFFLPIILSVNNEEILMSKIYARMISHPSGNLTFQVRELGNNIWTDKQLGFISKPTDNEEFMSRVNADLDFFVKSGVEVIWLT